MWCRGKGVRWAKERENVVNRLREKEERESREQSTSLGLRELWARWQRFSANRRQTQQPSSLMDDFLPLTPARARKALGGRRVQATNHRGGLGWLKRVTTTATTVSRIDYDVKHSMLCYEVGGLREKYHLPTYSGMLRHGPSGL
ncbi:hypothetical protein B0T16DRAFT_45251 [Cercophora newfieldiana]|uniref:Uncharacterized protein n=1 Tax=Cercophora newfieldiana TaxID=92897 RepID=A0AA39YQH5_9PEZI|nr:hypothetical protein B0T16DRAFT_45251 [Cercophora newfieldiana]